jgi:hypothetical protein
VPERRASLKQAINDAIRDRCTRSDEAEPPAFRTETAPMGEAQVDLDRALQVVAELEDVELIHRVQTGS